MGWEKGVPTVFETFYLFKISNSNISKMLALENLGNGYTVDTAIILDFYTSSVFYN